MTPAQEPNVIALPERWQAAIFPWLLPVLIGLLVNELTSHWGATSAVLHGAGLVLVALLWIGLLLDRRWAFHFGGIGVDLVILIQGAGGLVLEKAFDDVNGAEVLAELLFWAPVACAWWATCHYERPIQAVARAVALYACFFVGGQLSLDHFLHEFILQGALMGGLVLLFGRTISSGLFCEGPQAFDTAMHDTLTNVSSRAYFEAEMAHTCAVSERYGQPYSLILASINEFEGYCGDFGEGDGDRLLRAFSWLIAERVRSSDSVCRWEGEKFAILLPNTRLTDAVQVAEILRAGTANARLGDKRMIGASFGVSEHRPGEDPMQTFDTAERALGRAQGQGRNTVVADEPAAAAVA